MKLKPCSITILHSPFNVGVETLLVLVVLIALEAVLSADNAIALAAISQTLHTPKQARRALNVGLGIAYVLRLLLIASAAWVVQFWQFELLGAKTRENEMIDKYVE